ncbi:hypothetical protein [Flavobacterium sp. XGLA_31]|uniref:hypothetical protein n=1 Tax=Flavobacterium sp. XGLA_31 TaxID=3447666 RepID=UPI003F301824
MRKTLLYLFFFGLLLTTGRAFSFASSQPGKAPHPAPSHQNRQGNLNDTATGMMFSKIEVVNDNDNDNDDNEGEHESIPDSVWETHRFFFQNIQVLPSADPETHSKTKAYYEVNHSRLPRYTYISLRVIRI